MEDPVKSEDIAQELERAGADLLHAANAISDEMRRRDASYAAAREEDEQLDMFVKEVREDFEFELLHIPGLLPDAEDDYGGLDGADYGYDDDGKKVGVSPGQGLQSTRAKKPLADGGGSDRGDLFRVAAVLARRTKRGQLFYKVRFAPVAGRADFVTWQHDSQITNRAAVHHYEQLRRAAAFQAPQSTKRTRPVVYISARKLARLQKQDPEAAERALAERQFEQDLRANGGQHPIWSCEVEAGIFIPYDVDTQRAVETAYRARQPEVTIMVSGMPFVVNFSRMQQSRGGGAARRVQRVVPESADSVQRRIERMDVVQLRAFLSSSSQTLSDEALFVALSRLGELDKAVPSGVGKENVEAILPKITFGEVLNQISDGKEYPGLGQDCSICLDDYQVDSVLTVLPCSHMFHYGCCKSFLENYSKNCPYCRASVVEQ